MKSAQEELKVSRELLFSLFQKGNATGSFPEDYSEIIDSYFRLNIQESETGRDLFRRGIPFSLVAVGGYGRRELCLFSDIDILILFHRGIPETAKDLAEDLFYPLWDLSMDLGFGVRTIKDCLSLSGDDFEVQTSLMDGRFICGDSPLFLLLMEELNGKVVAKKISLFGRWLEDVHRKRMTNFGDASHLLEPNLKEGIGGLRDYHHILWMAKAFFHLRHPRELEVLGKLSHPEYRELERNVRYILLVRNHLHELSGRKNDRLSFEYQEEISRRLGYRKGRIPAVEQFLGVLHSSMESIKSLQRSFVANHSLHRQVAVDHVKPENVSSGIHVFQDALGFDSATAILEDPLILMDIFVQSSNSGHPLSLEARRLVKEFSHMVDDPFRSSGRAVRGFLHIINSESCVETLDQMFETGFLDRFIPEFGRVRDRVQFDAYHIFPVGRHMLETVAFLKNLSNEKDFLLLGTFSDLPTHEPLYLAGLFHDIGKNGKDHSRRGVRITKTILERFHYSKSLSEDLLFLIEHHLLLAETATRRDLNDEKVIVQCARKIGRIDRLKALYLLTWADSKATGPRAWNNWTGNLIQELFFKVLHILERGELATPDSSQKVKRIRNRVRREMKNRIEKEEMNRLFDIMPPRYLLNTHPVAVVRHIDMVAKLKENLKSAQTSAFVLDIREDKQGGVWELCFISMDRPGLFSDIAGVLALHNINILSTHIYTWRDGTVVDIFSVTRPLDAYRLDETWQKVERDLEHTFSGRLSLSYRLSQKAAPSILSPKKPVSPPEVTVDNKASDFFTIIEVFAPDRVGLLYLITRTLFDLRLDIRVAKTGVKGDQIADIFYVRDLEGQKLEDESQVGEIKNALLYQLKA